MKSFSILGGNPFSLALLVLLVLAMTPSGAAAPRKDTFLRKLQLGGYSEKPVDSEAVVAAADFAFATLQSNSTYGLSADATSYEVTSASTQVVAGLNIQMDITFLDSSGACVSTATVEVYDQFGEMSLTSYEVTDECHADESSGYSAPKGFTLSSILMISLMILSW